MLDIDFIVSNKPVIRQNCVYRYATGVWKSSVKKKLGDIANKRGKELKCSSPISSIPEELLMPSLFGGKTVFYDSGGKEDKKGIEKVLNLLLGELENNFVLFIPEENEWKFLEEWDKWVKSGSVTVLEEVAFRKSNIEKNLPQIMNMVETYDFKKLKNLEGFKQTISNWVAEEKEVNLLDFLSHMEDVSLTFIDSKTDLFNMRSYVSYFKVKEKKFFELHRLLSNLFKTNNQANQTALLLYVIRETPNGNEDGRIFIGSLYRAIKDLMIANPFLNPQKIYPLDWKEFKTRTMETYGGVSHAPMYRFSMALLKHEPTFYKIRPVVAMVKLLKDLGPI